MRITFITANFVARETGWAMRDWGHGDRATNDAFAPAETFGERFEELCRDVAALGFDTVDVWNAHLSPTWATDEHVATATDVLRRHGLAVASYQVYAPAEDLERAVELAAGLGARTMSGNVPVDDPRLPALLERHGLVFGLENHPEPTPRTMLDKVGDVPRVGVCVDTGWFATNGYDPARAIEELGDRIVCVHLKDVQHEGLPHDTCRFGDGIVDAEACVRALQRVGFDGGVAIEHEPETYDPSDEIRSMREQLEGWLA